MTITADQIVIAAGIRPDLPDVQGLDEVGYHTSDTVMRIDELPERMLILGGGFVAAEFAHVFSVVRQPGDDREPLRRAAARQDDDDLRRGSPRSPRGRWDVRLAAVVRRRSSGTPAGAARTSPTAAPSRPTCCWSPPAGAPTPTGSTWTRPASRWTTTGVVVVDEYQRTTVDGVWALGDVANHFQLKHVSNHEARVVQHNLLHPDDARSRSRPPRRAQRGVHPARRSPASASPSRTPSTQGVEHVVAHQDYGSMAYGWAMEDTTGFAKLLADPVSGRILGAHFIGPQASNLVQPLIQAMTFGQTAHEVAREQYWIHPALMEVVENLLLALPAP